LIDWLLLLTIPESRSVYFGGVSYHQGVVL